MTDLELAKTLKPHQVEKLIEIVTNFHWAARRYFDNRMTYGPSMFNSYVKDLLQMNITLNPTAHGTLYARDGMGWRYSGLSKEEYEKEFPEGIEEL
jgi:hypothetical protein